MLRTFASRALSACVRVTAPAVGACRSAGLRAPAFPVQRPVARALSTEGATDASDAMSALLKTALKAQIAMVKDVSGEKQATWRPLRPQTTSAPPQEPR